MALEVLRRRPAWQGAPTPDAPLVADVGTGSGAIALSLAQEAGGLRCLRPISAPKPLRVAAAQHGRAHVGSKRLVELRCADLLDGVPDACLHLVVGNPPYVASGDYVAAGPRHTSLRAGGRPRCRARRSRCHPPAASRRRPGLAAGRHGAPRGRGRPGFIGLRSGAADGLRLHHRPQGSFGQRAHCRGHPAGRLRHGHEGVRGAAAPRSAPHTAPDPAAHAAPPPALHVANGPAQVEVPGIASRGALESAPPARSAADPWTAQLRAALAAGAIIGVPTDTVYGIAARWDTASGIERLFVAKGRPARQPVQVLFPSVDAIVGPSPTSPPSRRGTRRPAAGTLHVRRRDHGRPPRPGRHPRFPGRARSRLHPLLSAAGHGWRALAATSANLSGRPDARTLGAVDPLVLAHARSRSIRRSVKTAERAKRRPRTRPNTRWT